MSHFRFVVAVFLFTAIGILVVYLRSSENRSFYKLCAVRTEQNRLRQEIWRKQLQVESLLNPAAVSRYCEDSGSEQR